MAIFNKKNVNVVLHLCRHLDSCDLIFCVWGFQSVIVHWGKKKKKLSAEDQFSIKPDQLYMAVIKTGVGGGDKYYWSIRM